VYSVLETEIAVVPKKKPSEEEDDSNDTADYELILSEDERFDSVPMGYRIRAHACYDSKKSAEDLNTLIGALNGIEQKLRKMDPYAAVNGLKKVAGGYAKFFELEVVDGKLDIRRKNNAMSFALNRGGMFVMFSKGVDTWEDMMACYDCRMYVEQAFDALKNELDGGRWRVSDPETARGRLVIKFVSLILWCTIAARLREQKKPEPVRSVIQSLDNILTVGSKDRWRVLEMTKKNRTVMGMFEIAPPGKYIEIKDRMYIPEDILNEVKSDLQ
jgi:hypothetical protein